MEFKKGKVDGKICDIIDYEKLLEINKDAYGHIAVQYKDKLYPTRGQNEKSPGVYENNTYTYLIHPSEKEEDKYSTENIIDFNSKTTEEVIDKYNQLKKMEKELLETQESDGISRYPIQQSNSPEMKALKEAINEKHINIKKYESRFGPNATNTLRLLNQDNISIGKFKTIVEKLDMKATIIIEDASEDVANPIGRKIIVDIINGGGDDE